MAYITLANIKKIIYRTDIRSLNLKGAIYSIPIYFLSKYEEAALLAIQELIKDPNHFFTEVYIPYDSKDTFTYVYEGKAPAYHKLSNCKRLNSDFSNFEIPTEIKQQGTERVIEFRQWFETVKHLLETPDIFVMRLQLRWGIITNPKAINAGNSGVTLIENYSIEELEKKIDNLIKEAGRFYYANEKNKIILKRFSKFTFLAYKVEPIENNHTGFSDEEVKTFLKEYDKLFKRPLKNWLIEFYRIKLNPELKIEGSFLEQVGFQSCGHCYNLTFEVEPNIEITTDTFSTNDIEPNIEITKDTFSTDELPF